jgi:hypothetical protein
MKPKAPPVNPDDWKAATPPGYSTVAHWLARHKPHLLDKGGVFGARVSRAAPAEQGVMYAMSSTSEQAMGFKTCRAYPGPWLHGEMLKLTA